MSSAVPEMFRVNGDRKQPGLEQGTNWGQNTRDTKGLSSHSRLGVSETSGSVWSGTPLASRAGMPLHST